MRRLVILFATALTLAAPASFAQEAPADPAEDTIVVPGSRIVRQDFEANSQVVTVGDDTPDFAERQTAWTSDADTTSSRTRGRASSTRVIRACEISLTLDGDCTGK